MERNRDAKKGDDHTNADQTKDHTRGVAGFHPGRLVITPGAIATVTPQDVASGLLRHLRGDWGNVDTQDWKSNDQALIEGSRLLSSYTDRKGTRFWIVTEHDRSQTTILLPDEY